MAYQMYPTGLLQIQNQSLNFVTDTIVAMLLTSAYTYSSTHQFVSSVVANEATGTTRQTLGSKSIVDNGTGIGFLGTLPAFPTPDTSQTLGYVAYYKANTGDSDHQLLLLQDPTDLPTNGENVTVSIDATGLFIIGY